MKKVWTLSLLFCLLCGCGVPTAVQTVAEAPVEPEDPFSIIFAVPMDAVLETFYGDWDEQRYTHAEGDYEILAQVHTDTTVSARIDSLTGRSIQQQTVLESQRFGMTQSEFSWYDAAQDRFCRAAILSDGTYCYELRFSVDADKQKNYQDCIRSVFSSFGLFTDEHY